MEPVLAPDDFQLLPLGTDRGSGSHKGYGLAVAVDILCSVLAGADFGIRAGRLHFRHYVAAYDIDAFSDVGDFKARMDDFIQELKATPPAAGHDRVLVAGQPEWEALDERSVRGIPLHRDVVDWFQGVCAELRRRVQYLALPSVILALFRHFRAGGNLAAARQRHGPSPSPVCGRRRAKRGGGASAPSPRRAGH